MRIGDVLGLRFLAKSEHDSRADSHAESDHSISNPNITEPVPTQQNTIDIALQPDTRLASVNPVILSNTAKLVVDSGCFDHCCPLDFASQFELREGRFLNASAANTIKLKHYGTRVVEGWARDVNGAEIPLKIRFNVFDVKSPLLSTSKLRKHGFSVVWTDTEGRHHDRVGGSERFADTGTETCEQTWRNR